MKITHDTRWNRPRHVPVWVNRLGWGTLMAGVGLVGLTIGAWLALGHWPWS